MRDTLTQKGFFHKNSLSYRLKVKKYNAKWHVIKHLFVNLQPALWLKRPKTVRTIVITH